MVAVLEQAEATDLEETLIEYVQAGVDDGQDLRAAAELAVRRLRAEGQGEALLDLFGPRIAMAIWRYRQHDERRTQSQSDGQAGAPRVNDAALTSEAGMLEMQFSVEPRKWVRLGDIAEAEARVIWTNYGQQASGLVAWMRFFQRIEAGLKRTGKTVRQRWTEEELVALRAETLKGEKAQKDRGQHQGDTRTAPAANGKAGGQLAIVPQGQRAAQPVPVGAN
jgi:hypothetical protein